MRLLLLALVVVFGSTARSEETPVLASVQQLTPVMAAAIGGDGRWIAVGLEDHAVVIWDTSLGKPVRTLVGHQKAVLSLAFNADCTRLLTGSADGTAALWDLATGDPVRIFRGHTGSVLSVAFRPDGLRCVTGSDDGTARVWDTKTGDAIHTLKGHTKEVMAVAYSPDGATVATAAADTSAVLWDADTGTKAVTLVGHKEGVSCVCFSPDGGRVGTGSWENLGIVWDRKTGQKITATPRQGNDVYAVAFSADGKQLFTAGREEVITLGDAATGRTLRTLPGHTADIVTLAVGFDGKVLLSGSRDGTVKLWDVAAGRELLTLATDSSRKTWAVVAPDGLFDASEAGRRSVGFRFGQSPTVMLDQLFETRFHPGLLAEIAEGKRPTVSTPLVRGKPRALTAVPAKSRVAASQDVTITVDVADPGDGVTGYVVEINGIRVTPPTTIDKTRATFAVSLAPGANKVRVRTVGRSGESAPAEFDLNYPRSPEQKSRMYVVAVGDETRILADLLQTRGAKLYDRVDVVPLFGKHATKAAVEDTVKDVAELTRPQDAIVVVVGGRGALTEDRLTFSPPGVTVSDLAASLGTAKALKRALVVDLVASDARPKFALRSAVERMARSHGVHVAAALSAEPEHLHKTLAANPAGDVADWFRLAEEKARPLAGTPSDLQISSQARGFPILPTDK